MMLTPQDSRLIAALVPSVVLHSPTSIHHLRGGDPGDIQMDYFWIFLLMLTVPWGYRWLLSMT